MVMREDLMAFCCKHRKSLVCPIPERPLPYDRKICIRTDIFWRDSVCKWSRNSATVLRKNSWLSFVSINSGSCEFLVSFPKKLPFPLLSSSGTSGHDAPNSIFWRPDSASRDACGQHILWRSRGAVRAYRTHCRIDQVGALEQKNLWGHFCHLMNWVRFFLSRQAP